MYVCTCVCKPQQDQTKNIFNDAVYLFRDVFDNYLDVSVRDRFSASSNCCCADKLFKLRRTFFVFSSSCSFRRVSVWCWNAVAEKRVIVASSSGSSMQESSSSSLSPFRDDFKLRRLAVSALFPAFFSCSWFPMGVITFLSCCLPLTFGTDTLAVCFTWACCCCSTLADENAAVLLLGRE